MIVLPCLLSSRKNSTIVSTRARKRWERPEGGERAGHRLHNDRICACHDRGKDGIHLPMVWWMGNISDAFAGVPCLTPLCRTLLHIGFPPSNACVLTIRRLALAKPEGPSSRNHALRHSRRRTANRSCLMRDTR